MRRLSIPAPARCTLAPEARTRRFILAVLAQVVACARPSEEDGVRVEMRVEPQPPTTGPARIAIEIRDAQGGPLEAMGVALEANMTHPGMTPVFATATPEGPGRWLADVELTMGGDWVVLVEARLQDGRRIERSLALPGVAGP